MGEETANLGEGGSYTDIENAVAKTALAGPRVAYLICVRKLAEVQTCAFSQPSEQRLGFCLFLREDIYRRSIRKKESVMMIRLQLRSRKKMFTRKKRDSVWTRTSFASDSRHEHLR